MNTDELSKAVNEVVGHLRANGFEDDATEFQGLMNKINTYSSDAAQAAEDIQARCHVKWLGDVPIKNIPFNDWLYLLDRVKVAAS